MECVEKDSIKPTALAETQKERRVRLRLSVHAKKYGIRKEIGQPTRERETSVVKVCLNRCTERIKHRQTRGQAHTHRAKGMHTQINAYIEKHRQSDTHRDR